MAAARVQSTQPPALAEKPGGRGVESLAATSFPLRAFKPCCCNQSVLLVGFHVKVPPQGRGVSAFTFPRTPPAGPALLPFLATIQAPTQRLFRSRSSESIVNLQKKKVSVENPLLDVRPWWEIRAMKCFLRCTLCFGDRWSSECYTNQTVRR